MDARLVTASATQGHRSQSSEKGGTLLSIILQELFLYHGNGI